IDRDAFGRVLEYRYFLANGTPGQSAGPAVVHYVRSKDGQVTKETYSNQEPVSYKGCAAVAFRYDEFRQLVERTCFNPKGEPAADQDGVASTHYRYDARGFLAERSFHAASAELVNASSGFAKAVFERDPQGTELSARHFRADGSELKLPRFRAVLLHP